LYRINFLTNWNVSLVDTNISHRGLGTVSSVGASPASLRLLDSGGIQMDNAGFEPTNFVYRADNGMYYFLTPSATTWSNAESYATSLGGNLATVASSELNSWLRTNFVAGYWIGLCSPPEYNNSDPIGGWVWISGSNSSFRNWDVAGGQPNGGVERFVDVATSGGWHDQPATATDVGLVELAKNLQVFTGIVSEPAVLNRYDWRGSSLASGLLRGTNGSSVFYTFADDKNANGLLDLGDDFVTAEYLVSGTNESLLTVSRKPIAAPTVAQSYGLACVDFLGTGNEILFTAEPDGQIFAWTGDATNSLQRQLFSLNHYGEAWHALTGVKTTGSGDGLAGLMVDPANPNTCNVIYWPPQTSLPQLSNLTETAPYAVVLPSGNPLGSNSVITVRLWDNEGNPSTPLLQYQILGWTNWQNATLTTLDGSPYGRTGQVTALPTGSDHNVTWNALADVGNTVTNILLRARAQDFMLVGNWSQPTPFQLNTALATNPNPTNSPVNFTGMNLIPGGISFRWQGGSNAWLYLQSSPALVGTNAVWINIWTGAPPMPNFGSYTDFFGTNQIQFYRLKIGTP
jgi:hypothetical protein